MSNDMNEFRVALSPKDLSLRDWFAGQALAGAMACPTMRSGLTSVSYATMSYELADAMLAARTPHSTEER